MIFPDSSTFGTSSNVFYVLRKKIQLQPASWLGRLGEISIARAGHEAHDLKVSVTGLPFGAEAVLLVAFFAKVGVPLQGDAEAILKHSEERHPTHPGRKHGVHPIHLTKGTMKLQG